MHPTPTTAPDQAHYSGLVDAQTADLARYLDLHAGLNGPLPHLEIADRRAQRDRLDRIPHIDADARRRQARNDLIRGLDEAIATAVGAVAVVFLGIGLGAAALFVGSVL